MTYYYDSQVIFKHLWRSKHIELVLTTKIWREQVCNAKAYREMRDELSAVSRALSLITSQMMHFVGQIQVYILFEVIECEWLQLVAGIERAASIDDILDAHQLFLDSIKTRIFLDEDSRKVSGTLETIYRTVLLLDGWQDRFYATCGKEWEERRAMAEEVALSERLGQYGVTKEQQFDRDQRQKLFQDHVQTQLMALKKIAYTYEQAVRQFLLLLAESNDYDLQMFGTRIDFNDYFKKNDARLQEQGTFARQSSIFQAKKGMGGGSNVDGSPRVQGGGGRPRYTMPGKMMMAGNVSMGWNGRE